MVAPAQRRLVTLGVLRSLAAAVVLVALYYLLPLDHLSKVPLWVILVVDTVTTFSTVGYGDITAASQTARVLVTVQMILDLLALGLGIRVFIGAVQLARQRRPAPADPAAGPDQPRQTPA